MLIGTLAGASHREPRLPVIAISISPGRTLGSKGIHIMKITKQLTVAWMRKEGASVDQLVVVHSHPTSSSEAEKATQKFEHGKAVEGFIPIVFLDEQLDSSELRSWLQAEAIHRRSLI